MGDKIGSLLAALLPPLQARFVDLTIHLDLVATKAWALNACVSQINSPIALDDWILFDMRYTNLRFDGGPSLMATYLDLEPIVGVNAN